MKRIEGATTEIRRIEAQDRTAWEKLWHENLDHFAAPDQARADMPVIRQRLMDQRPALKTSLRSATMTGLPRVIRWNDTRIPSPGTAVWIAALRLPEGLFGPAFKACQG